MPADPPLHAAALAAGLNARDAHLLHNRANAVYHLPHEAAIVRMRHTRGSHLWEQRLASAVQVTAWLAEQGYPTVQPLPIQQPLTVDGWTITFWQYVDIEQAAPWATAADLALLLQRLHSMATPPIDLVATDPLGSLPADLEHAGNAIAPQQRDWLTARAAEITQAYASAHIPLGQGLIHGDAYGGNLFASAGRYLVGDWDSVSHGPRAQDLIPTLDGVRHFGQPHSDWIELCAVYGADPQLEHDPGIHLLAQARELRSLAAYIRAVARPAVHAELDKRLNTLITGEPALWRGI